MANSVLLISRRRSHREVTQTHKGQQGKEIVTKLLDIND